MRFGVAMWQNVQILSAKSNIASQYHDIPSTWNPPFLYQLNFMIFRGTSESQYKYPPLEGSSTPLCLNPEVDMDQSISFYLC